jgi:endonuclease/exonuclease/phosphatase family metal-dependent hydrolase
MARYPTQSQVNTAVRTFLGLSRPVQLLLVAVVFSGLLIYLAVQYWPHGSPAAPTAPGEPGEYLFCFWNVENLFDDQDDKRRSVDEEFDNAFAADAALREKKYDHIAAALLKMNDGRGPDVIACVEVESTRAANLLKDTLNRKLDDAKADPKLRYTQVAMKDLDAGRHIAPCVISRVPVNADRTRLYGRQLRILETELAVGGQKLSLIASHWTSQLKQKDGSSGDGGRDKYAGAIHDLYVTLARSNPKADLLICGDFNDTPDAEPVVQTLKATGDRTAVTPGGEQLLDLLAGKDPARFGTHYYNRPLIYDHIVVSPGMLDAEGWSCDPDSVRTVTDGLTQPGAKVRRPWRFDSPKHAPTGGRGYSDHFPVTVKLTVRP